MRTSSVEQLILALFAEPLDGKTHFTAHEVFARLKPRLPAVNPSTVYRALERMTHAGKISVSDMGLGAAVYEAVGSAPHHHLVCEGCHQVVTLENGLVDPLFGELAQRFKFEITTNHLVVFGYCEKCKKGSSGFSVESQKS
ncbi:MAG: Fur family transcriptional regulator [Chloroflexota bacterium]